MGHGEKVRAHLALSAEVQEGLLEHYNNNGYTRHCRCVKIGKETQKKLIFTLYFLLCYRT